MPDNSKTEETRTTGDGAASRDGDIESMRPLDIRRELENLGVNHLSMFERYELVAALKKARAEEERKQRTREIEENEGWSTTFDPEFLRAT